ncbi:LysE family translocator [Roseibium denhamense]|uniref:Threonine/homoserine/homoserine lactone efflux protein n=1 Tax=Roseibium denhamense TaxID=76305 RepID=A0ABY1PMN6_9HYPH|nr:LysE family translocator [Roseibium denhamense]MTI04254.1 LysE family translocator [Roseibium denhamense]SMP37307.1 Threonine/homoserine/homoserine lactone efflux protein [Roseibium denhamense]
MSLEFLITALIVVLVPGTGVVYTVAVGLGRGRQASIAAAFGCTLGIIPAILASVIGLAALMHTSALVFTAVKYAGVAYLLFLAWQTLKDDSGPLTLTPDKQDRKSLIATARTGFLINILNPKLTVFFLAFLPQFVSPAAANPGLEMLLLGGVFMAMTFAVFVVYGAFAAVVGDKVLRSDRVMIWMKRTIAATFAGFGLRLALADR